MSSEFTFVPLSDSKSSPDSVPAEWEHPLLIGAPIRAGQLETLGPAIQKCLESEVRQTTIVPLDGSGHCQWSRLPLSLARLTADPLSSALFFVPRQMVPAFAEGPFWKFLLEQPEDSVTLCDPVPGNVDALLLPALVPDGPRLPGWMRDAIASVTLPNVISREDAVAVQAGLFQFHDDLDRSHSLSQSVQGAGRHAAGDYWHAIMHRREPDYGNSKYWFRRVGSHPVFDELSRLAEPILGNCPDPAADRWKRRLCGSGWDPMAFVDCCESCEDDEAAPLARAAREIQLLEMLLLLDQTCCDACR